MTDAKMQLEDWLDDLCVRFIINLPEEDLSSVARICFQVEEAQWFYEDFIRPLDPSLPSMSLRSFCLRIFQHCPLLSAFSIDNHMRAFEEFLLYKTRVPVRGAIMLNHALDAVVLVKGWKKGSNWSFPRGKINKDEDDLDCAVREVYEETGYDIRAAGLVPEADEVKYIDIPMREQHIRLYVFRDVPMDTHFEPKTRKEISRIEWYRLSDLPAFKKKNHQIGNDAEAAKNANKFYMVAPFLVPLKKWVQLQKRKDSEHVTSNQYLSQYPDDGQTEEEGFRSAIEGFETGIPNAQVVSRPELNTMEGATTALHKLLKIQPATQGLQPSSSNTVQHQAGNSGDALLAILRGNPQGEARQASSQPPHNPAEFTSNAIPIPDNSNQYYPPQNPPELNHQLYNSRSDRMQYESLQSHNYSATRQPSYHPVSSGAPLTNLQVARGVGDMRPTNHQQQSIQGSTNHTAKPFFGMQSSGQQTQNHYEHQPQFLQHPQPLPPHVQQGVFTGGLTHGPISTPQFMQQDSHQLTSQASQQQRTLFPPAQPDKQTIPSVQTLKPSSKQLTGHSLALLNAFRNQDTSVAGINTSDNHSLASKYTQSHVTSITQPQELPSEHLVQEQTQAHRHVSGHEHQPPQLRVSSTDTKSPPTDMQKTLLLSLFKSPGAAAAPLARPATTETPQITMSTAAVHAEPSISPSLTSVSRELPCGPLPDGNLSVTRPKSKGKAESQSRTPDQQQLFRPTSILTRPVQPVLKQPSLKPQQPTGYGKGTGKVANTPRRQADVQAPQKAAKPFAPQILKRPPQGPPPMPAELSAISPTRLSTPGLPTINGEHGNQPSSPGHKQALLSLFKKLPEPSSSMQPERQNLGIERPMASREGDITDARQIRRTSYKTSMSSTDKGFLLGYLDTIAKGGL